jgi:glycosyltransferase involved in cell wall biosynthesis
MRLAMLTETTGPGGLESMMLLLAQGLRERGHEVVPIIPSHPREWLHASFLARGFEVEEYPPCRSWGAYPGALMDLTSVLRRRRVEALHCHDFTAAILGTLAATMTGIPSVLTLHGGHHYREKKLRRWLLRRAARRSASVIAVSSETARQLTHDLSLHPEEVQVIPNGTPMVSGEAERGRRILGTCPDTVTVLAVGRLIQVKGFDILSRAARLLQGTDARTRMVVAGDGEERRVLEGMNEEDSTGGQLSFLGMRDDIPDLMAGADIFVMPSRSEGLPMALIEAMAAGLPVVASSVGGIPEVVEHGVHGLLVDPEDPAALAEAIAILSSDPALRARMGRAGHHRVKARFSIDAMVDAYEQRLLGRSPLPGY